MKKYLFPLAVCSALLFASCGSDNATDDRPNTAPSCKITAPIDGQSYDASLPLVIKGRVSDTENNVVAVRLTVGGEPVDKQLDLPFFEYEVAPDKLTKGPLTIDLFAEDAGGLTARHRVTIDLEKESCLMVGGDGSQTLTFGYWTEEREARVIARSNWTITLPGGWVDVFDSATGAWSSKTTLTGQGETTVRLRARANDLFDDRIAELKIATADERGTFLLMQTASPDMLELIEDEMLRMAAGISVVMYDMDPDEDGKISAYEAELAPADRAPYGFDAGGWDVASTKGIENFPHLRHLDVNTTDKLTEIDLSGNHELMSIHVHNCPNLKSLDLSQTPQLIELGCEYGLFLAVRPEIERMKGQMHTLGIFNRKADQPAALDFTGFGNLQRLYVNNNGLTELKLGGCTSLWRLIAGGNAFAEIDLSEVDRYPENDYFMDNNPNLKRIYVWKGFTLDYYTSFKYDEANGVEIIEK